MISSAEFRQIFRSCANSIALAALQDSAGPAGLTINSLCSVSLSPPLLSFCIRKEGYLHRRFCQAAQFRIFLLHTEQEDIANHFSQSRAAWPDFSVESLLASRKILDTHPLLLPKLPLLPSYLTMIDCISHACHEAGDHSLFLAKIIASHSHKEVQPLLYCQKKYGIFQSFANGIKTRPS